MALSLSGLNGLRGLLRAIAGDTIASVQLTIMPDSSGTVDWSYFGLTQNGSPVTFSNVTEPNGRIVSGSTPAQGYELTSGSLNNTLVNDVSSVLLSTQGYVEEINLTYSFNTPQTDITGFTLSSSGIDRIVDMRFKDAAGETVWAYSEIKLDSSVTDYGLDDYDQYELLRRFMTSANTPAPYVVTESSFNTTFAPGTPFEGWRALLDEDSLTFPFATDLWVSEDGQTTNQWVAVDFGELRTITGAFVDQVADNLSGRWADTYRWQYSQDGSTWQDIVARDHSADGYRSHKNSWAPLQTRYIRYFIDQTVGGSNNVAQVSDIEFFEVVNVLEALQPSNTYVEPEDLIGAYAMKQIVEAYTGPVVRLRRATSGNEQDFTSAEMLAGDYTAFAAGEDLQVAILYDQSPSGNNLVANGAGRYVRLTRGADTALINGVPGVSDLQVNSVTADSGYMEFASSFTPKSLYAVMKKGEEDVTSVVGVSPGNRSYVFTRASYNDYSVSMDGAGGASTDRGTASINRSRGAFGANVDPLDEDDFPAEPAVLSVLYDASSPAEGVDIAFAPTINSGNPASGLDTSVISALVFYSTDKSNDDLLIQKQLMDAYGIRAPQSIVPWMSANTESIVTVDSSSFLASGDYQPWKLFDGKLITSGGTEPSRWISDTGNTTDQWVSIDLGQVQAANEITLWQAALGNRQPRNVSIQVSDDNANWRTVALVNNLDNTCGNFAPAPTIEFPYTESRYWRVFAHDNWGHPDHITLFRVELGLDANRLAATEQDWFQVQVTTTAANDVYGFTASNVNELEIDWGDGSPTETKSADGSTTHTYANAGTYAVRVRGSFTSSGSLSMSDTGEEFLTRILSPLPEMPQLTNVSQLFKNAFNLAGSIPGDLFANNPGITAFFETFQNCTSLTGSIPATLFANNTAATSFSRALRNCSGLTGSIPETLFANNTAATNFFEALRDCDGLTGSIPATLFANNTAAENFTSALRDCSSLTGSIPATLFSNNTAATNFTTALLNCTGLTGSIPATLFSGCPNVTNFRSVLRGCSGLTGSIPATLFSNNTAATNFGEAFRGCSSLAGSIPATLFATNTAATSFKETFLDCTSLTGSIPATLFANCPLAENFTATFRNCSGLTGIIPGTLFANNLAATNFSTTFMESTGFTGIGAGLFDNNTAATNFSSTFNSAQGLTGAIPSELFANNLAATTFFDCFRGCQQLQVVDDVFYAAADRDTRFFDQSVNFSGAFQATGALAAAGTAPDLWAADYGTGTPTTADAFASQSASTLTNFADIPAAWL